MATVYGYDPLGYANGYAHGYAPGYADDGSQSGPGPAVGGDQSEFRAAASQSSGARIYTATSRSSQDQSGLKLYQAPPSHPYADAAAAQRASQSSDQPTIYLIALRDHTIVQALGYWMEGSTLHYVSAEHTLNQLSIDLVDRDLSQRLNDERGLDFRLPQPR